MYTELFQKQYDFELEQRNSIASAINIPIVAITAVASATCAILLDFQYSRTIECYAFIFFASVTIISICFSASYLFRSFWNYVYKKLPTSSLLKQHRESLKAWHLSNGASEEDAQKNSTIDFEDYLRERLADATDWNSQNNIVRGNFLHLATAAVACAVITLLPAGAIYIINKATAAEHVHLIKIINQTEAKGSTMATNNSSNTGQPAAPAAPAPATNPKPSGPPNTEFKGNTDMPKPTANNNQKK